MPKKKRKKKTENRKERRKIQYAIKFKIVYKTDIQLFSVGFVEVNGFLRLERGQEKCTLVTEFAANIW